MSAGRKLRELLAEPGGVLSAGLYDCLSARVAEAAGFPCGAISGNGLTASLLGYPDVGLTTMTEIAAQARNIAHSVAMPVLCDVDNGFGNALNVTRTVYEFETAGLAGIQIEDQKSPRKSSTVGDPELISPEEGVAKIRAAVASKRDKDFVIVARSDARMIEGLDKTIERMKRYMEAGADVAMYSSLQSEEEMRRVIDETPGPVKLNVVEGYPMARYTCDALFEMGFAIVGYSGFIQRSALKAMQNAIAVFQEERTTEKTIQTLIMNPADRNKLLKAKEFREIEAKFL